MNIFFYYLDTVSLPPHVYILSKGKNVTILGFLLSLITYISLLYVTIKNILQLYNKEYKSIIYSESQELNTLKLNSSDFYFILESEGTEDFKKNISFDIYLLNYDSGDIIKLSYTKNDEKYYINEQITIDDKIKLIIDFYCLNNNCTIFNNKDNFLRFGFFYRIYLLEHKNFTNPLNENSDYELFYYTPDTTKSIVAKVKKLKYITKGGIKWDKNEERNIIGNIKEIRVPNQNITQLGLFKIELDTNSIIYERIYPSIIDIFSSIGGFKSTMKIITYFIIILYSETNNNCFIIENIFKKGNSNIKNKILLMNKIHEIKNIESITELNETKENLIEKYINNEKKVEYYKFEKLFNINFFQKIFRYRVHKDKRQLMNFCNEFVKKYLSVENIILNQLYCEEYYKNNNNFLNKKLKADDNILKNT